MKSIISNSFLFLFFLSVSCWSTMTDLNCPKNRAVYRKSFCDLMEVSDVVYLGRVIRNDSLSSTKLKIDYDLNSFPYNDSIYGLFVEKYRNSEKVYSRLNISIEYVYSNSKWKKIKENKDVYLEDIRGWTWNGLDPDGFNYHHPVKWDDLLRIFFIRKTSHGDSLIGYSKSYKTVDSVQTSCFESRSSCKEMIDGCHKGIGREIFCKTYEPYTISETDFYSDIGDSEFFVYGKITSVSIQEIPINKDDIELSIQSMNILKDSLRNECIDAVRGRKRYDVVYKIKSAFLFDGKWKSTKTKNFEIHSIQEQGFDWFLSPSLYKVEIDSLDSSNRIFRTVRYDDGSLHLVYVSKTEPKLPKKKSRRFYARKPDKSCLTE